MAGYNPLVVTRTNPLCKATNFETAPWDNAFLVTPQHTVGKLWNDAANRKHCTESGNQLFICPAEDSIKKKPLTMRERFCVAGHHTSEDGTKKRQRDGLPDVVGLAIGMKVMVTSNVQTDLDITNGARGAIQDIILHPDEPPVPPNTPIVKLTYLPSYVLVKLNCMQATQLQGLETSVVPIEAPLQTFHIATTYHQRRKSYLLEQSISSNTPFQRCTASPTIAPRVKHYPMCLWILPLLRKALLNGDLGSKSISSVHRLLSPPSGSTVIGWNNEQLE
ncbi:hypothetical protein PHLCEN_2v6204 [Hermanssonia centrifuga]|uniref:Uncharacterized protein n=1 Tax=Hermanssonia centrifuga TaxID=98765 RepID=A0A2R6P043_9APHY|nr:hypothetical protein PHLCEN_2v6204 [Hermanssonia centrifuga]